VTIRDWIPRRKPSAAHWRYLGSPNSLITLSLGGDIFTWYLEVGPFSAGWEK
jgi:hypothetical protein